MIITFKYNNKQYTTNNLEKKLKKLGITEKDIELLGDKFKPKELEETDKRKVIVRSTKDDIRRVCFIPKDYTPTIRELFKDKMWDPVTKTGIKYLTEEFLMTMYYDGLDK